jgi:4-hydroxybenzoate polyprenyltransferase/phosphoserine phosphatase
MMQPQSISAPEPPLVIDLDGTLIRGDLLQESALRLVHSEPWLALCFPFWLIEGKAALKRRIAERVTLDVASLPYDERLLAWIAEQRQVGRHVLLCTASDSRFAEAVASHLGCFDEVIASDGRTNFSAARKAEILVQRFGHAGFDYAGNSHDDVPVWAVSRRAIVVSAPSSVLRASRQCVEVEREFKAPRRGVLARMRVWSKALRLHQWLKNLLVFVPLVGAHRFADAGLLAAVALAFVAFGLCASAVYVMNDLMDLESDRRHPRKRARPFAAGVLSPLAGLAAVALLLLAAAALAWAVGPAFSAWLGVYFVVTLVYTFWAKRELLIDALTLAGLHTLRVVAGAAAAALALSFWLLAFSLFLFLSLAFVKRYSELLVVLADGRTSPVGRSYMTEDLALVEMLGVASGFSAVLVLALYLNSEAILLLYSTPQVMWLAVPVLLYWISRMWMQAHRGQMDDDPLLHAVRDPVSVVCGALFFAVLALATLSW